LTDISQTQLNNDFKTDKKTTFKNIDIQNDSTDSSNIKLISKNKVEYQLNENYYGNLLRNKPYKNKNINLKMKDDFHIK